MAPSPSLFESSHRAPPRQLCPGGRDYDVFYSKEIESFLVKVRMWGNTDMRRMALFCQMGTVEGS
uniref:Uncharacterized protein n=1 Tax=Cucumis melo TaxID=3656 RepID=A0A9I9DFI1_CUCME